MAEIRIDQAAVERMLRSPSGMVGRDLRRRADRVVNRARQLAPGSMPSKITPPQISHRAGDLSATITSRHGATLFVLNGTRPHQIRPRFKQALRFQVGGRTVFAKVVQHPGTKADDFMNRALREAL